MCGICGIWNYKKREPVNRSLLDDMADAMVHRGPDTSGMYCDDSHGLGLGFRRLSIIDPSPVGNQPMSNENKTIWVVCNGEIYNFLDLRSNLEVHGHIFSSKTDTEVIPHLYEEDKTECIKNLFGMFGLAIWDSSYPRIVLARDRIGKKPLYYYDDGIRLIFASELKAIVNDPSVPRHLDLEAVVEYLRLGYIGSPRTIFKGICKLSPGTILVHDGRQMSITPYWDWLSNFQSIGSLSEDEWVENFREMLREAVRIRMISDVPLGAFLSGGIDSSAVVAMMAELSDRPVKTFSIGFENQSFSELHYARQVARHFNTDHHEHIVKPEAIVHLLPRLVKQLDEPFADASVVPTYYVSKIARQRVTVCLSGDGGDESMAGYKRYNLSMNELWVDRIPLSIRKALLSIPVWIIPRHYKFRNKFIRMMLPRDMRYARRLQIFNASQARRVLSPEVARYVTEVPHAIDRYLKKSSHLDYLSQMQYLDGVTYLPEDILVKVDRTSTSSHRFHK
ncbi:MAG: asparagine synthase (glutamine-hydrolyzing) [bacterium]